MSNWSAIKIAIMNFFRPRTFHNSIDNSVDSRYTGLEIMALILLPVTIILLLYIFIKIKRDQVHKKNQYTIAKNRIREYEYRREKGGRL